MRQSDRFWIDRRFYLVWKFLQLVSDIFLSLLVDSIVAYAPCIDKSFREKFTFSFNWFVFAF